MTKWNIPEGRKPLTDADMAALTRRLAGTAVDYKELYEAAKRDAEEAEAYAGELEAKLKLADEISNLQADRIQELEVRLAEAKRHLGMQVLYTDQQQSRAQAAEAKLQDMALDCLAAQGQAAEAYQAQLAAEAELATALERGFWAGRSCGGSKADIDAALAELKGEKDE